jgi:hypothetical protein
VQRLLGIKGSGKKIIDLSVVNCRKENINVYNKNIVVGTAEFIKVITLSNNATNSESTCLS